METLVLVKGEHTKRLGKGSVSTTGLDSPRQGVTMSDRITLSLFGLGFLPT